MRRLFREKFHQKHNAQAAMEYLMTYGWSILIIAVILGALTYLGVFNPNTFAPRAPPGSCKVFRAGANVNLEGICNGELPQYVMQFNLQGIGQNSYVDTGNKQSLNFLNTQKAMTISVWVYPTVYSGAASNQWDIAAKLNYPTSGWWLYLINGGAITLQGCTSAGCNGGITTYNPIPLNGWTHIVALYAGNTNTYQIYINGVLAAGYWGGSGGGISDANSDLTIDASGTWTPYEGDIANVQMYNATLDANSVVALYKEGIGGAPISTASLVGWWPLNGDTNDYSGNGNNGVPTNVALTNQWLSGYTTPSH